MGQMDKRDGFYTRVKNCIKMSSICFIPMLPFPGFNVALL
jgi:hypothetical protein